MELPKTAKQIKNSKDYIDIDGSVYTYVSNYKGIKTNKLIKKTQFLCYGYCYCDIYNSTTKKNEKKRVHRLIAEAFIPNPNNYPIVGHKNNIKNDNRIENLYWTTNKENVQKAVDDGLLVNDKGIDDSQSMPVNMYKTTTNELLASFGSCHEAARETQIPISTICRQAKYHRPVRKEFYFRYQDDETAVSNNIIGMFDVKTDKLIETYFNINEAARKTNMNEKTIADQIKRGKPNKTKFDVYFAIVKSNKCEQTIENLKGE